MKMGIVRFIKKQWLLLWIVACVVLLVSFKAYAEYSARANTMKRVIVATEDQGQMFSSNYLITNGELSFQPKYVGAYTSESDKSTKAYDIDVFLYNYSTLNIYDYYNETIYYSLTAELVNQSGNSVLPSALGTSTIKVYYGNSNIEFNSNSLASQTITGQSLLHSTEGSSEKKYTISFSGDWDFEKDICIRLKTDLAPAGVTSAYKDIIDISRIIGIRKSDSAQSSGWDAYISEITAGSDVDSRDGFNLVASGSGQATITINWKPDKIVLNKNFYVFASGENINGFISTEVVCQYTTSNNVITPTVDANGWATLTINADASNPAQNYRNRYNIQVYKTGSDTQPTTAFFAKNKALSEASENEWIIVNIQNSNTN